MDAAIVNRFFKATSKVLSAHYGIGIGQSGTPQIVMPSSLLDEVTVIQALTGDLEGQFVCGYPLPVALALARRLLDLPEHNVLDKLAASAISELSNIIAGHASTDLAGMGYYCSVAPPLLLHGNAAGISMEFSTAHLIAMPLLSGAGEFRVYVGLKQHLA